MIRSINYSQHAILKDIIDLHLKGDDIECDPTFSKGVFYRNGIQRPAITFDLLPLDEQTVQADCRNLPLQDESLRSMCFDPPFVIGSGPSLLQDIEGQSIIQKRFSGFRSGYELWEFYRESLREFYRVLKPGGVLIFKSQDVVGCGKQWLSHVEIINTAVRLGFYAKDLFVLNAKARLISGKVKKQQHARKFHSYFLVFIKEPSKVQYS